MIEGGDGDHLGEQDVLNIRLSRAPDHKASAASSDTVPTATVTLLFDGNQLALTDLSGNPISTLEFTGDTEGNWDEFQSVLVKGLADLKREGFHTSLIEFEITSGDTGEKLPQTDIFRLTEAVFFVGLTQDPIKGSVTVKLGPVTLGEADADGLNGDFGIEGNKVLFVDAAGDPVEVSGDITVTYEYKKPGFDQAFAAPVLVRISDADAPTVLVRETGGSTDVIESASDDPQGASDQYSVVLTGSPDPDKMVKVMLTPENTKTTRTGGIRHDEVQVEISSADDRVTDNGDGLLTVVFNDQDWDDPVVVDVRAIDDGFVDGGDTKEFAPGPNTVSGILGPVFVEGAGGAGSLSLPAPVMLPGEINRRPSDGNVVDFTANTTDGPGAVELMTVETQDLEVRIAALELASLDELEGLTIEMSRGPGVDVILNPDRPDDKFDRFWLIEGVQSDLGTGETELTLRNPSQVDPGKLGATDVPDTSSEYAITALSANFFVDETAQVDFMFVHDEDSPADSRGVLTATRLSGLNMGPDLIIGGQRRPGGITYNDLEVLEINLGTGGNDFEVLGTHTREDGYQTWTFLNTGDDIPFGDIMGDHVTVVLNAADDIVAEGTVDSAENADAELGIFENTVIVPEIFEDGALAGYVIEILEDDGAAAGGQRRRILGNTDNVLTVDRPWEVLPDGEAYRIVNEADGAFAVNTQGGDDVVDAEASSLGITIFGGLGSDHLTGGSGDDVIFGDRGRVDYFNADGAIVTRLGDAPAPITGFVTEQVTPDNLNILIDDTASFPVRDDVADGVGSEDIGLEGLYVDIINGVGFLQTPRLIAGPPTANTETKLTLKTGFDPDEDLPGPDPDAPSEYRISTIPENQTDGVVRQPNLLLTIDSEKGGADTIHAGAGDDQIFGGAAGDTIHAGDGVDFVVGDGGRLDRTRDPNAPSGLVVHDSATGRVEVPSLFDRLRTISWAQGGADTVFGDGGADVLIGGAFADAVDGGADDDLIFGDNVHLVRRPAGFDPRDLDPTIKALLGTVIYDGNGTALINQALLFADPRIAAPWAELEIVDLDHSLAIQDAAGTSFGNDYLAGGADDDVIFGQLGDDTIQGDGSILGKLAGAPVGATRLPDGTLGLTASFEADTDGDDYVEGNGGDDVIFGNLGQDDLIGGSSSLFTLTTPELRPDGSDIIFGGAGVRLARDDIGDTSERGHARDADYVLGDNGNLYRLVDAAGQFLAFNYDTYTAGLPAGQQLRIVPRAFELLDYTLGGAPADLGASDLVYGGPGDDVIHGMTGNDVLYGNGQDDDLYGGWGHDKIFGGSGQDGVVADDGLLLTSRNGTAEPLYGQAATTQALIDIPGGFIGAVVDITGMLKKTVDLLAYELGGHDIVYGGLGDDWIHGGAGDDAISGAEALSGFYTDTTPQTEDPPIGYDPATGKLEFYDADNPRTKIPDFLLNFDAFDAAGEVIEDGKDRLFGDLGNDWLVGGTGHDRLFGGFGDDLLNIDDNHDTNGGRNDVVDDRMWGDFAFGGGGRDVLIANTGLDRMFDWLGEFNSFIVPFARFGAPTVNRSPSPHIRAFLLALGAAAGADPTLTEPDGELGLVTQQDPQWGDQHGAPRDPQPGNGRGKYDSSGGPEDDTAKVPTPHGSTPGGGPAGSGGGGGGGGSGGGAGTSGDTASESVDTGGKRPAMGSPAISHALGTSPDVPETVGSSAAASTILGAATGAGAGDVPTGHPPQGAASPEPAVAPSPLRWAENVRFVVRRR